MFNPTEHLSRDDETEQTQKPPLTLANPWVQPDETYETYETYETERHKSDHSLV